MTTRGLLNFYMPQTTSLQPKQQPGCYNTPENICSSYEIGQKMSICSPNRFYAMTCSIMTVFLRVLTLISCLTLVQSSYPTDYILSRNAHIRKDLIQLGNLLSNPSDPPYTTSQSTLNNFKTSKSQKLKPLTCLSKLIEYNFQQTNYVIAFSVRLNIIDDGASDSITKYEVKVGNLYQRQAITDFDLQAIFFSKDTELYLTEDAPIFYSFHYSSDKLHPNKMLTFDERINLPVLLNEPQFRIAPATNNYTVVWYLTGVDIQSDPNNFYGINTQVSIINPKQLNLNIAIRHPPTTNPPGGRYIRLLQLSILLYNSYALKQTQHFMVRSSSQYEVANGYQFTTQNFTDNPLMLDRGEFLFGIQGVIMGNDIKKINYQLDGGLSSDNLTISVDIILDSSLPVEIIQTHFLYMASVQCPLGYLYEQDMNNNKACIQGSSCKINYHSSTQINYGQESCFQCLSACAIAAGQTIPKCVGQDLRYHPCTPQPACLSNQTKVPQNFNSNSGFASMTGSSNTCVSCTHLFGINCTECNYQQCTSCITTTIFAIDACISPPTVPPTNCTDNFQLDTVTGKCVQIVGLKLINWEKVEFSNKVIVNFKLSYVAWKTLQALKQSVDIAFSHTFADQISQVLTFYDETQQQLTVQILYNNTWIEGLQLTASLNFDPTTLETLKFTSPQTSTVKLQMGRLGQSYFLINHDPNVYSIAVAMSVLYKIAAFLGFGFILAGYLGGKYIVLQVMAVLQITFLGLLQLEKYTPFHLAANRLSTIAGNFVFSPSPLDSMSQLNTLKLEADFLGNFNIQIVLFLIFLIIGGSLRIFSKVKKSQKSVLATLIGMILVCEYSLYGLLVFSYLASASIGLQIKYEFIDKIAHPNYFSLGGGLAYVLVVIGYMFYFVKRKLYFGEFAKEMKIFSIDECFICFVMAEKIIVGFLLGLLCNWRYIGFLLAALQAIFLAFVLIKQPFFYSHHSIRIACDHGWVIVILVSYNLQRLYFEDYTYIDSNPWMYAWPLTIIVGVYIILVKNAIAMGKQIRVCIFRMKTVKKIYDEFTKYCEENGQAQQVDIEETKKIFLQRNLPEKIQLTNKQISLWKKLDNVQKYENQFTTNDQQVESRQHQQLLRDSFKGKKELKRLKENIRKKIKAKNEKQTQNNGKKILSDQNYEISHDSQYSSLESKQFKKGQNPDQEFESLLSKQKQRLKMTVGEHWMQIDEQVKRFQNLDQVKETPEELQQKYVGLQFVHENNSLAKLPKNKTLPIKNMKILQMNPILSYYRNEIDFEIHTKTNPFEELKDELEQQRKKLEDLTMAQIKKLEEQERQRQRLKQKAERPAKKKLMYRGGEKYGDLAKDLNDKNVRK